MLHFPMVSSGCLGTTLYIEDFGGDQARAKRTFGILVPLDGEEEEEEETKSRDEQVLLHMQQKFLVSFDGA